jgi:hypothetical protein
LTRDFKLGRAAQAFADELTDPLNRTVCDGPRLRSVIVPATGRAHVGFGIDVKNLEPRKGIPIAMGKAARCYLGLSYQLRPDDFGAFLMVHSSMVGLFRDQQLDHCLFHYDYERNKPDWYPEAHLQVNADSEEWLGLLSTTPGAKKASPRPPLPEGRPVRQSPRRRRQNDHVEGVVAVEENRKRNETIIVSAPRPDRRAWPDPANLRALSQILQCTHPHANLVPRERAILNSHYSGPNFVGGAGTGGLGWSRLPVSSH